MRRTVMKEPPPDASAPGGGFSPAFPTIRFALVPGGAIVARSIATDPLGRLTGDGANEKDRVRNSHRIDRGLAGRGGKEIEEGRCCRAAVHQPERRGLSLRQGQPANLSADCGEGDVVSARQQLEISAEPSEAQREDQFSGDAGGVAALFLMRQ
jgi:hypothetical protein